MIILLQVYVKLRVQLYNLQVHIFINCNLSKATFIINFLLCTTYKKCFPQGYVSIQRYAKLSGVFAAEEKAHTISIK